MIRYSEIKNQMKLQTMNAYEWGDDRSEDNAEHMYELMASLPSGTYLQEYIHSDGTSVMEIAVLSDEMDKWDKLTEMCERMPVKEGVELWTDDSGDMDIVGYYGPMVTVCRLTFIK